MQAINILESQIIRQIENATVVKVYFTDSEPDQLKLYDQDETWIKPLFCSPKRISRALFDELVSRFTGEQQFNTDPEIIYSGMGYDEFYDRYYNKIALD